MQLAREIRNNIPVAAFQLIMDEEWKGGAIISLKEQCGRPSASELARNSTWLSPMCSFSPRKARSLYMFVVLQSEKVLYVWV